MQSKHSGSAKPITQTELARLAGVSRGVVSAVINGRFDKIHVSEKVRRRVLDLAERNNYVPHPSAKALRTGRTMCIGMVVPELGGWYSDIIAGGAEAYFAANGYAAIISSANVNRTIPGLGEFQRKLDFLQRRGVDGLFLVGATEKQRQLFAEAAAGHFLPWVVAGLDMSGTAASSVSIDNRDGTRQAMGHLLDLGHRYIGLLKDSMQGVVDCDERIDEAVKMLAGAGLPVDTSRIAEPDGNRGIDAARELLLRHPETTAVFTTGDHHAYGAIIAADQLNRHVPETLSVVGFDDLEVSEVYRPPLTTVHQQIRQMGQVGAQMLLDALSGKGGEIETRHVVLRPTLVVRESTGRVNLG